MPWKRTRRKRGRGRRFALMALLSVLCGAGAAVAVSLATGLLDSVFASEAMEKFLASSPSEASRPYEEQDR